MSGVDVTILVRINDREYEVGTVTSDNLADLATGMTEAFNAIGEALGQVAAGWPHVDEAAS